jgi:isocitrate dehydrogenase
VKVYPAVAGMVPDVVDQWRCRFMLRTPGVSATDDQIAALLQRVSSRLQWAHIEKLQMFDGQPGFSKAQGED